MTNTPEIKILAISNVYCRSMHFKNKGDVELGHCHMYDHGTLISHGEVLVETLDDNDVVLSQKIFTAPSFVFISKFLRHRITALQDNTVAACIHAIREIGGDIVSPEFLMDEKKFVDKWQDSDNINDHFHLYTKIKRGVETDEFCATKEQRDFHFFMREK